MSKRDFYDVLGLERGASENEIKRAYRKMARQYHPDVNQEPEAEALFKEISEAYEILSDPQNRAAYDHYGHAGVGGAQGQGFGGGFDNFGSGFGGLGDIFEAFFGGGRDPSQGQRGGRSRVERGSDLRLDLEIPFREAIFGADREVEITHLEICELCSGDGAEEGSERITCQTCRGSGQIQQHQRTAFGTFAHVATCPKCRGQGTIVEKPCKQCSGKGVENKKKTLKVPVPPGTDTGVRLALNGQGDAGPNGGPAGDLYLVLHVQADPEGVFERHGNDIHTEVSIGYAQAALGDTVEVPTLEGPVKHKVPAGIQPGTVVKLKNKGVPYLNAAATRGDLFVKFNVAVPTKVNKDQRQLLENLFELEKGFTQGESSEEAKSFSFSESGGLSDQKEHKKKGGFFDVLKETWKSHHHSKDD